MSNPNINVWGATYNGVTGVTLPTSGGGTATFPWVEGSQTITTNNTYDVTNLAEVVVSVSGGGGGLEYETGTYTPTADIARPTISFTNTHTTAPFYVLISDSTGTYSNVTNSNYAMMFTDFGQLHGGVVENSGGTAIRYGEVRYTSRSSSTTSLTAGAAVFYTPSTDTRDSINTYMRYWVTETGFKPYCNNASRYWRTGRTYKWIAVWKP